MYTIRPYSEFLQEELMKFIKSAPDQWQAKVLMLLDFKTLYALEELVDKSKFSDVYILKSLLAAEEYGVVLRVSDKWLMNENLAISDLNHYLALDISDYEVKDDESIDRLVRAKTYRLAEQEKTEAVKKSKPNATVASIKPASKLYERRSVGDYSNQTKASSSYDDYDSSSQRPVDGYGRKRKDEWNNNEALQLNRQVQERIKAINAERMAEQKSVAKPVVHKKPTDDEYRAEQLFIELCNDYPEYEDFLTRRHKLNGSYTTMAFAKAKIYQDLDLNEFGMPNHPNSSQ